MQSTRKPKLHQGGSFEARANTERLSKRDEQRKQSQGNTGTQQISAPIQPLDNETPTLNLEFDAYMMDTQSQVFGSQEGNVEDDSPQEPILQQSLQKQNSLPAYTLKVQSLYQNGIARTDTNQHLPCSIFLQTESDVKFQEKASVWTDLQIFHFKRVCMVDCSFTSKGLPIYLIKEAIQKLVSYVSPLDRLAVITYDQQVRRVTNLERIKNHRDLSTTLDLISTTYSPSADLSGAIKVALKTLKGRREANPNTYLFILSTNSTLDASFVEIQEAVDQSPQKFQLNAYTFGSFEQNSSQFQKLVQLRQGLYKHFQHIDSIDETILESIKSVGRVFIEQCQIQVICNQQFDIEIISTFGERWQEIQKGTHYNIFIPHISQWSLQSFNFLINIPKFTEPLQVDSIQFESIRVQCQFIKKCKSDQRQMVNLAETLQLHLHRAGQSIIDNELIGEVALSYYRAMTISQLIRADYRLRSKQDSDQANKILIDLRAQLKRHPKIQQLCANILTLVNEYNFI